MNNFNETFMKPTFLQSKWDSLLDILGDLFMREFVDIKILLKKWISRRWPIYVMGCLYANLLDSSVLDRWFLLHIHGCDKQAEIFNEIQNAARQKWTSWMGQTLWCGQTSAIQSTFRNSSRFLAWILARLESIHAWTHPFVTHTRTIFIWICCDRTNVRDWLLLHTSSGTS